MQHKYNTTQMHFYKSILNIATEMKYLSARTFICGVSFPQLLTIHAASKAARKPRAIPVPKGQKGYTHQILL